MLNKKTSKLQSRSSLRRILSGKKKNKKKIVFTNGCFDIIHLGHINLFKKARSFGDILVVGINSDSSLKRLKGSKRPLVKEIARAKVLSAIEYIDYVTIFSEDTPKELIQAIKPDILVKGSDYKKDGIVGREFVKKVVRFPMVSGYSTTNLINKIVKLYS